LKGKDNIQSTEHIKSQLKKDINPTDIKVGIKTLKTMRDGRILIETCSEEEIYYLSRAINTKYGEKLEIMKHKLRKPRLIIYNVPEEITIVNVTNVIKAQNPEIAMNGEEVTAKFRYKTRNGNYNILIEVGPRIRKQILHTKQKIGWEVCKVEDYLVPTRCFSCSRFYHKHSDCKGEEICPHCPVKHKLKECTAPASEHKFINCITYNR